MLRELLADEIGPATETKVENDRFAAVVDQDIARLQVAVNDAALVGMLQGQGQLADQLDGLGWSKRLARHEAFGQTISGDKGHGQVGRIVDFANFIQWADVGVLQGSGGLGFAQKAGPAGGGIRSGQCRDLEHQGPIEPGIVGEENRPHAALAEQPIEAVNPKWPRQRIRRQRPRVGLGRAWSQRLGFIKRQFGHGGVPLGLDRLPPILTSARREATWLRGADPAWREFASASGHVAVAKSIWLRIGRRGGFIARIRGDAPAMARTTLSQLTRALTEAP